MIPWGIKLGTAATSPDAAHAIVVTVSIAAGTFTVTNERTGASRTYPIH